MADKLNFGLDPAAYLAMTAQLCSGSPNGKELMDHADQLLSMVQSGDFTVVSRNAAALILSEQLTAQVMVQRALQAETPAEAERWLNMARTLQQTAESATTKLAKLKTPEPKPFSQLSLTEQQQADLEWKRELVRQGKLLPFESTN